MHWRPQSQVTAVVRGAQVLVQAGGTVKEEVCRSLVVLLTNAPDLHGYAARAFFRALRDAPARPPPVLLATTAAWFLGARARWAIRRAFAEFAHYAGLLCGRNVSRQAGPDLVSWDPGQLKMTGARVPSRRRSCWPHCCMRWSPADGCAAARLSGRGRQGCCRAAR